MIASAATIAPDHVDLASPASLDHILAAARRIAVRDGLDGLTRKGVATEAGVKEDAIGLIGPLTDHLIDYVFAALIAAHADIRDQPRPNRSRAYGMIEELFAGEPDLAALVMIVCALAVPTGASSGATTAAGRFRQMRRATELALVEDVANDHHFGANPDTARSYAAEMIADYIEIAARIWATDGRNPAPRAMAPVSKPIEDAEPTEAPSESEPGSGHILIDELRAARSSSGWSRVTLGERVGVDAQTIKRIEQGRGSVETLVKVMAELNFRLVGLGKGDTFAEQLRNKRDKQSPAKLAKKAGISPATLAALERGQGTVASLLRLLAVLAPRLRRRAPERAYWGQGDKNDRDSRFTSPAFIANIYAAFGEIDLDPCGHVSSPVIANRRILFAEGGDGLTEDWSGRLAYVNPPYSAALRWLNRAHEQWIAGNVQTVVCLVPVRTESALFQDVLKPAADIYFLRGRPKFIDLQGKAQHTPFSIMVVMLGATAEQKRRYAELVPGLWMTSGVAVDGMIAP